MAAKEQITIAGQTFSVPSPYETGHPINAGEADALNQTFHENIRNNLAKLAKDGNLTQEKVDEYSEQYEFGVRSGGGGGTRDPVRSRAMDIARDKIKNALIKAGKKFSDFSAKQVTEKAAQALDMHPEWLNLAKQQYEAEQSLAADTLDDVVSGMQPNPAPAEQTPA